MKRQVLEEVHLFYVVVKNKRHYKWITSQKLQIHHIHQISLSLNLLLMIFMRKYSRKLFSTPDECHLVRFFSAGWYKARKIAKIISCLSSRTGIVGNLFYACSQAFHVANDNAAHLMCVARRYVCWRYNRCLSEFLLLWMVEITISMSISQNTDSHKPFAS